MSLESLKAILLKKSAGNADLQEFIQSLEKTDFSSQIIEALEKMATKGKGSGTNTPLIHFAKGLDASGVTEIHDAFSHHVSHYKAALHAMNNATDPTTKAKMRGVADKHLDHLVPMMDMVAKAHNFAHNEEGQIGIKHPELAPWEANYTTLDRSPTTRRLKLDPKVLSARPKKNSWAERSIKDWHYLERPPHPGHSKSAGMPHTGGYPWEEVQIGSPSNIAQNKAYPVIEDIPDKTEYTPHPFDSHPLRVKANDDSTPLFDVEPANVSDAQLAQFKQDNDAWKTHSAHAQWKSNLRARYAGNVEGYKQRGSVKPSSFWEGLPLQEVPKHVINHMNSMNGRATPVPVAAAPSTTPPPPPAPTAGGLTGQEAKDQLSTIWNNRAMPGVTVRRGQTLPPKTLDPQMQEVIEQFKAKQAQQAQQAQQATPTSTSQPHPMEELYRDYMDPNLKDHVRSSIARDPDFQAYLAERKKKDNNNG